MTLPDHAEFVRIVLVVTVCAGCSTGSVISRGGDAATDAGATGCDGLPFVDPVLEAGVRDALGQPTGTFTASELASVTRVVADGAASLEGVHCLVGLVTLSSSHGTMSDLSPLAGLVKLEVLVATHNMLMDLSPLAGLAALRSVVLAGNRIVSLLPLSGHSALGTIRVPDNMIASLDGLTLPDWRCGYELDVQRNPIGASDVAPFCATGWVVIWGGDNDAGTQLCNLACL